MSATFDFDRELAAALEEGGPTVAPDAVVAAALALARSASQRRPLVRILDRRAWPAPPFSMGNLATARRAAWVIVVVALVLAIGAALLAVGAFGPDRLGPLGRNGSIAYAVGGSGVGSDVAHLLTVDGATDVEIGQGTCPRYSGDGRSITWRTGWRDTARVVIAAPDGTGQIEVPGINDAEYALSPDGTLVAWMRSPAELWVMPIDGGAAWQVAAAESNQSFRSPTWSPDGDWIALAVMRQVRIGQGSGAIRLAIDAVSVDGTQRRRLTNRIGTDTVGLAWSPDGRRLAYLGVPDVSLVPLPTDASSLPEGFYPPLDVFVTNADGIGERPVTNTPAFEFDPRWSPDGERLAFIAFDDDSGYRLTVAHSDMTLFTEHHGPSAFEWSPDGTRFVYIELINDSGPGVWVKTIDSAFAEPAQEVDAISTDVLCPPSWQRLEP